MMEWERRGRAVYLDGAKREGAGARSQQARARDQIKRRRAGWVLGLGVGFGVPAAKTVATRLIRAAAEKTCWAGQARDSSVRERERERANASAKANHTLAAVDPGSRAPPSAHISPGRPLAFFSIHSSHHHTATPLPHIHIHTHIPITSTIIAIVRHGPH